MVAGSLNTLHRRQVAAVGAEVGAATSFTDLEGGGARGARRNLFARRRGSAAGVHLRGGLNALHFALLATARAGSSRRDHHAAVRAVDTTIHFGGGTNSAGGVASREVGTLPGAGETARTRRLIAEVPLQALVGGVEPVAYKRIRGRRARTLRTGGAVRVRDGLRAPAASVDTRTGGAAGVLSANVSVDSRNNDKKKNKNDGSHFF